MGDSSSRDAARSGSSRWCSARQKQGAADYQAGFIEGFKESVEEQGGGPITAHELEGVEAQGGPIAEGYALSFTLDNAGITVVGADRGTAEFIANGLLKSA